MKGWQRVLGLVTISIAAAIPASAQAPAKPPTPAPAAAPAAVASAGTVRIAVVDVQRVLARSAAGVSAREQLEREKAVMQKEMDGKRVELEKLRDEIEKKGSLMTAEARRDKQDLFERKRRDAARLADDFQNELKKKEEELLQKVLQDIGGVITHLAKDRGFGMVIERQRVLYAAAEADLTDDVIRMYDQEANSKGAAPKGAQEQGSKGTTSQGKK